MTASEIWPLFRKCFYRLGHPALFGQSPGAIEADSVLSVFICVHLWFTFFRTEIWQTRQRRPVTNLVQP